MGINFISHGKCRKAEHYLTPHDLSEYRVKSFMSFIMNDTYIWHVLCTRLHADMAPSNTSLLGLLCIWEGEILLSCLSET